MKSNQITDSSTVTIHIPLFISRLPGSLKQGLCLSVCAMFLGTVAAMGSGSA
jgi:hypothetical protein